MEQKIAQLEENIRQLSSNPTSQTAVETSLVQSKQIADNSGSSAQVIGSIFPPGDLTQITSGHNIFGPTGKTFVPSFDSGFGKIPIEDRSQTAISAFLSGTACLFHTLPPEECRNLTSRVYHRDSNIGSSDICELCAIAAVGCRYDGASEDNACMIAYFQKALLLLCDAIEKANMQTIRILTCLSMYLILDRSIAARLLISSALHLTRWYRLVAKYGQDAQTEWSRVFRTLTSLETWLSFALGCRHGLRDDEIHAVKNLSNMELSSVASEHPPPTTISIIQSQLSKVTLLAAEVFSRARFGDGSWWPWERLEELSSHLDVWRQELPASLELQRLASNNNSLPEDSRRALFLVHMVYLEDRVILYQHFMQQASDACIMNMPSSFHQIYATFAHQLAWIIGIIFQDRSPFLRNWLAMSVDLEAWSYHANIGFVL
ncbi:hypothetical protein BO85DRAFT_454196 [Aspergillus piperis CBS 112811]|uniref:Transcription factor domain-containing protein n=1 Tax=Aspergillus piperis CBS 112811 TaxID=1448313 RepID=A0A8G1QTJ4_9EURO|nr:hypothetical protein BO85DRAFT_454196 [Aspergillus piperis CBS 112811]RAH52319.1 hypothetical protein BO85DRAFT_454196 [Aspergillus piperis CBS 112811]